MSNRQVNQLRRQHADHDGELVDRHELAALLRRADFGDIHWTHRSGQADTDTANDAEHHEQIEVCSNRRAPRGKRKQDRSDNQRDFAAQFVGAPAGDKRAKNTAHQRRAHRPAGQRRVSNIEIGLVEGFRPANHHPVVTE